MDLYRYFHPHHNPRLRGVALRLQELIELRSGTVELRHALSSALRREPNSVRLKRVKVLLTEVIDELNAATDEHPGDSYEALLQLMTERRKAPGWENWVSLLESSLELVEGKMQRRVVGGG